MATNVRCGGGWIIQTPEKTKRDSGETTPYRGCAIALTGIMGGPREGDAIALAST
jgi:hypothetical protein